MTNSETIKEVEKFKKKYKNAKDSLKSKYTLTQFAIRKSNNIQKKIEIIKDNFLDGFNGDFENLEDIKECVNHNINMLEYLKTKKEDINQVYNQLIKENTKNQGE